MLESGARPVGGAADKRIVIHDQHLVVKQSVAMAKRGLDFGFLKFLHDLSASAFALIRVDDYSHIDATFVGADNGCGEKRVRPGKHSDAYLLFCPMNGFDQSVEALVRIGQKPEFAVLAVLREVDGRRVRCGS